MATPVLNHVLFLLLTESILVFSQPSGFHFYRYVQMDNSGSVSADVKACEGPKRQIKEAGGGRGSEWELIKIVFKNSAYEPDFTRAPPQASLAKST
jgi:hypothetical protein